MNIVEKIITPGQGIVSTMSGKIQLEEGQGRLAIYDSVHTSPMQVHDVHGSHYFDVSGNELVTLDESGFSMNDGQNERIIIGRDDGGF